MNNLSADAEERKTPWKSTNSQADNKFEKSVMQSNLFYFTQLETPEGLKKPWKKLKKLK